MLKLWLRFGVSTWGSQPFVNPAPAEGAIGQQSTHAARAHTHTHTALLVILGVSCCLSPLPPPGPPPSSLYASVFFSSPPLYSSHRGKTTSFLSFIWTLEKWLFTRIKFCCFLCLKFYFLNKCLRIQIRLWQSFTVCSYHQLNAQYGEVRRANIERLTPFNSFNNANTG